MTKIEIINEIKNVVKNNGGSVNLGWVTITVNNGEVFRTLHGYSKNIKSEKVSQIQIYLDCLNDYVAKNAKTVETEVENDTEKNVEDMTKNEIIAEFKKVIIENNPNDEFDDYTDIHFSVKDNGDVIMRDDYVAHNMFQWKNIKYLTKKQLVEYFNFIKWYYDERKNGVTNYLAKDTEYVAEPKATKKDILMGLNENGEVKCDLATAEALATEGFIGIKSYEDGVLYGDINTVNIIRNMCDDYCGNLLYSINKYGGFNHEYLESAMVMFDHKLISSIEYEGDGGWRAELNWENILIDFCKRWDDNMNEAA